MEDDDYNPEEDYNEDYNSEEEDDYQKEEKDEKIKTNLNEPQTKDYEIIQNSEIIKKRDEIINKFIEFSNLNYDEAELVLVYYDWNYDKLMEYWFDNMEKIQIESHTMQSEESTKEIEKYFSQNDVPPNTCLVCQEEYNPEDFIFLKCEHILCKECYIEYILNKLDTEPNTILITTCPLKGCNLILTHTIFKKCIKEKIYKIIFAK